MGKKKRKASSSPKAISPTVTKLIKKPANKMAEPVPEIMDDNNTPSWALSLHTKFDQQMEEISSMKSQITCMNSDIDSLKSKSSSIDSRVGQLEGMVHDLAIENKLLRNRVQCLAGRTIRNELKISQEHEAVLDLQCRSMRDNVVFPDIPGDYANETIFEVNEKVFDFLENKAGIKESRKTIRIERAHRMGIYVSGSNKCRPVVVKFLTSNDKDNVMKIKRNNRDIRIFDQFPEEIRERRRVLGPILKNARDKKQVAKLSVDKLYINGQRYYENAPAVPDFGSLFDESVNPDLAIMNKNDIKMGTQQIIKGSTFQGFAAHIVNLTQVRNVIDCLKCDSQIAKAQHISYAFCITDEQSKIHESYCDDGEHSAGKELLSVLKSSNVLNSMVVCVRWPGKNKLGILRFDTIKQAAKEALDKL